MTMKYRLTKNKINKIKKKFNYFGYSFLTLLLSLIFLTSLEINLVSKKISKERKVIKNLENIISYTNKLDSLFENIENKIKGINFLILKENCRYNINLLTKKYPDLEQYLPKIIEEIEKNSDKWSLDPIFILSLMKVESNFDWKAISPVGAVGLFQITPEVARYYKKKDENLFIPDYYFNARKLIRESYKHKSLATKYLFKGNISLALKHKKLYEEKKREGEELMKKYRRELLKKIEGKSFEEIRKIHFIFDPDRNIEIGINLLASYSRIFKGDASEILTAYIAGKGKAMKHKGLNPYDPDVIKYFNWIKNTYKKFRELCKE